MNYEKAIQVKNLARSGWMIRGIPPSCAETVAAHTFEVSLLTLILSSELISAGARIDLGRALSMAIIHDVPESVSGDIVKWVKRRIKCADEIDEESLNILDMGEYSDLIREFNNCETIEALIVKLSDNLATYLQARRYVRMGFREVEDIVDGSIRRIQELLNKKPLLHYKNVLTRVLDNLTS